MLSRDGKLVITEMAQHSSIASMDPDGSNRKRIFEVDTAGLDRTKVARGMAGAFAPSWSPDGQWIAFGLGEWFQERHTGKARIMRVRRDGTGRKPSPMARRIRGSPVIRRTASSHYIPCLYRELDPTIW